MDAIEKLEEAILNWFIHKYAKTERRDGGLYPERGMTFEGLSVPGDFNPREAAHDLERLRALRKLRP